jgi:hypothetical protein
MVPRPACSITSLLACALMASWVAGAGARGLAQEPPKGLDLSGDWQFNAALSTDVNTLMAERRTRLQQHFERERLQQRRRASSDDMLYDRQPIAPDKDFAYPLAMTVHMTILQANGQLRVTRTLVNGDRTTDQYQAGDRSVASFGTGVADRFTGWRGRLFVVSLRAADDDARKEERYSLTPDGRLVVVTLLSGGGLPQAEVKSVYDRRALAG